MEVDVAKGRRDWAFSERDKVNHNINFYYLNYYIPSTICNLMDFNNIMKVIVLQNLPGGSGKGIDSYTVRQITPRKRPSCI